MSLRNYACANARDRFMQNNSRLPVVALLQYKKPCYANGSNRERRAGTSTLFAQMIIIPKTQTLQIKVLSNRFKLQTKS